MANKKVLTRREVLDNKKVVKPCFPIPEDTAPDEIWAAIPENYYTVGINSMYRISNYGRIINVKRDTPKVVHCYERRGMQYYTLVMEDSTHRYGDQEGVDRRNYTLANLLLHTFRPIDNIDARNLKPVYLGDRSDVYVDKMIDGKLQSNIQWDISETGKTHINLKEENISRKTVHQICQLLEYGWSINRVALEVDSVSPTTIGDILRHRIFLEISRYYDF